MSIYGVFGGIGSGKTLSVAYLALDDLKKGKKLYSNIAFKFLPENLNNKIHYLRRAEFENMLELVKLNKLRMENSTVCIQELHNYMDSRSSQTKTNKLMSYWILQSRHTGKGSCDIIYDTQRIGQIDIRVRNNTDFYIMPQIINRINSIPKIIRLRIMAHIGQNDIEMVKDIDVYETAKHYDTHEVII
jgi:hypothetical protein